MTTYNSRPFVTDAVESILAQTHDTLELIIVDDASTDGTLDELRRWEASDDRLRILPLRRNRGTHWAKNLGLMHATGEFVTFQDSDDRSSPERLERQVSALAGSPGATACTAQYVRVDPDGEWVSNRGQFARLSYHTLMFHRTTVLSTLGFFDSVRYAADDEFFQRLRRGLPPSAMVHLAEPLYFASVREGSLTELNRSDLKPSNDPLGHLSPERRRYVLNYQQWHKATSRPTVPFPPRSRPFPAPARMWDRPHDDPITAALASIPARRGGLQQVVRAVLPQVDQLYVYLNGYRGIPSFLDHPRVTVATSQDHGDIRDNGKFFFDRPDGYHFALDDDIHYPPNYVAYMTAKLQQYDHRCVVGFHGISLRSDLSAYLDPDSRDTHGFQLGLAEDADSDVLGTGTIAYHTDSMQVDLARFETTGMADIWFAVQAKERGVPLVCVARAGGFLRPVKNLSQPSLYKQYLGRDREQTRVVREHALWDTPTMVRGTRSPDGSSRLLPGIETTFVKIYGMQRSGTNWLKYLLEANFEDTIAVDLPLGNKHEQPRPMEALNSFASLVPSLPLELEELPYGLEDLSAAIEDGEVRAAVVIKPLLPWLASFFRLRQLKNPDAFKELTIEMVDEWTRRWVKVNESYVEGLNQLGWRYVVLDYVDMLADLDAAMLEISGELGLTPTGPPWSTHERAMKRSNDADHGESITSHRSFDQTYYLERSYLEELGEDNIATARRVYESATVPTWLAEHAGEVGLRIG